MDNVQGEVVLVKDINTDAYDTYPVYYNNSSPRGLTEFNGKLYFSAFEPETGRELWSSDGTTGGTQIVADVVPGSRYYLNEGTYPFDPVNLTEFDGKLYFSADDGVIGNELWVTDGTTEGTQLVADISPGVLYYSYDGEGSDPDDFTELDGKLYFSAFDPEAGRELWVTDGTTEGTQLVIDITPGFRDSNSDYPYFPRNSNLSNLVEFNDKLYFAADDGENGNELWVSDGTAEGTQLFVDINPGGSPLYYDNAYPSNFTEFDGKLYFSAFEPENGRELWVTDGTAEGTQLFADIVPGSIPSNPGSFAVFDDKLYFSADDGENNRELWVTDGTEEGTQLFADISPNGGSYPGGFTELNGKLYFSAFEPENGGELWVTDGTEEGTQLAVDINPNGSSNPGSFAVLDGELYFAANDEEIGRELYKLTFDDVVDPGEPNLIEGTAGNDTIEGTEGDDRIKGFSGDDVIFALGGNDTVFGDIFSDRLEGGDGDDDLLGGFGNDTLNGGNGNDLLVGREGNDLFVLAANEGTDTIADFNPEQDSFELSGDLSFSDLTLTGNQIQIGDSVVATVEGVDTSSLTASNFNEEPTEPDKPNLIEGTQGNDTIEGTEGDDRIKGFRGDDVIFALGGNDTVFGDIFSDEIDGGDGDDDLLGGFGNDTLSGGNGNDLLVGREGNDFFVLTANEGADTIADFDFESDRFILAGGLAFEDLSFNENSILVGEETLATVEGVDTTNLTADNFV